MILQARTESIEMFIAMYETEEPKREDYIIGTSPSGLKPVYDEHLFKTHLLKWQSSKREYKVRKEDEDLLIEELYDHYKNEYSGDRLDDLIQKSIDCSFLKDRLNKEHTYGFDKDGFPIDVFEWTLLPLEDKKENEAVEFVNWMRTEGYNYDSTAGTTHYYKNDLTGQIYSVDELYQLFKNPNKQG